MRAAVGWGAIKHMQLSITKNDICLPSLVFTFHRCPWNGQSKVQVSVEKCLVPDHILSSLGCLQLCGLGSCLTVMKLFLETHPVKMNNMQDKGAHTGHSDSPLLAHRISLTIWPPLGGMKNFVGQRKSRSCLEFGSNRCASWYLVCPLIGLFDMWGLSLSFSHQQTAVVLLLLKKLVN